MNMIVKRQSRLDRALLIRKLRKAGRKCMKAGGDAFRVRLRRNWRIDVRRVKTILHSV